MVNRFNPGRKRSIYIYNTIIYDTDLTRLPALAPFCNACAQHGYPQPEVTVDVDRVNLKHPSLRQHDYD